MQRLPFHSNRCLIRLSGEGLVVPTNVIAAASFVLLLNEDVQKCWKTCKPSGREVCTMP